MLGFILGVLVVGLLIVSNTGVFWKRPSVTGQTTRVRLDNELFFVCSSARPRIAKYARFKFTGPRGRSSVSEWSLSGTRVNYTFTGVENWTVQVQNRFVFFLGRTKWSDWFGVVVTT